MYSGETVRQDNEKKLLVDIQSKEMQRIYKRIYNQMSTTVFYRMNEAFLKWIRFNKSFHLDDDNKKKNLIDRLENGLIGKMRFSLQRWIFIAKTYKTNIDLVRRLHKQLCNMIYSKEQTAIIKWKSVILSYKLDENGKKKMLFDRLQNGLFAKFNA